MADGLKGEWTQADGRPVFPDYRDSLHCVEFNPQPKIKVYRGWDFGLTPACSFSQVFDAVIPALYINMIKFLFWSVSFHICPHNPTSRPSSTIKFYISSSATYITHSEIWCAFPWRLFIK